MPVTGSRCLSVDVSIFAVIINMTGDSKLYGSAISHIFLICDNICKRGCKFCHFIPFLWPCINNYGASSMHSLEDLWRNSSVEVNETTKWNTVNWCAPQHQPCSQPPCVILTGRQLCKRIRAKGCLVSQRTQESQAGTPSSDGWPSRLLMKIKAAKCNLQKQSSASIRCIILNICTWESQ